MSPSSARVERPAFADSLDSWCPLPAAFRSRIFEKFFRLEHHHYAETRPAVSGSICADRFVELHGARWCAAPTRVGAVPASPLRCLRVCRPSRVLLTRQLTQPLSGDSFALTFGSPRVSEGRAWKLEHAPAPALARRRSLSRQAVNRAFYFPRSQRCSLHSGIAFE
jgi:hypothetical protein